MNANPRPKQETMDLTTLVGLIEARDHGYVGKLMEKQGFEGASQSFSEFIVQLSDSADAMSLNRPTTTSGKAWSDSSLAAALGSLLRALTTAAVREGLGVAEEAYEAALGNVRALKRRLEAEKKRRTRASAAAEGREAGGGAASPEEDDAGAADGGDDNDEDEEGGAAAEDDAAEDAPAVGGAETMEIQDVNEDLRYWRRLLEGMAVRLRRQASRSVVPGGDARILAASIEDELVALGL